VLVSLDSIDVTRPSSDLYAVTLVSRTTLQNTQTNSNGLELALRYSRFASRAARRDTALFERVIATAQDRPAVASWREGLTTATSESIDDQLRDLRRELMLRTVYRDVAFAADFRELVLDLSVFADMCVQSALRVHSQALFDESQPPYGFSVVAMGKMGGNELNVSSDIDIVFICEEPDADAMDRLARLANAVTRTLDRVVDGEFVFRVDTRLRPYGSAGPTVATLDFLEHYFVTQGRMWERIAWLRARVCAGVAEQPLSSLVTPFVFRRYLDFDAISGMRDLHTQLRAEKTDQNNIKLGRGGIRELEFGTQLQQLLRGGRDARLRTRNTIDALVALADAGYISRAEAATLDSHYRFLRRTEHLLQYREDLQTQTLPSDANELGALAEAMGAASVDAMTREIAAVRDHVASFFDATLNGLSGSAPASNQPSVRDEIDAASFTGFRDSARIKQFTDATLNSSRMKSIPAASRDRLQKLFATTLSLAVASRDPDEAAVRTLDLLCALASRSSYLALMTERPNVLRRVVDLAATSEWAVRYLSRHPLLLDELIDARSLAAIVNYDTWRVELTRALEAAGGDTEAGMDALRHFQQAETFRLLLKDIAGQFSIETLSDHLSALADVCVDTTLRKLLSASQLPMQATLSVIAYGKWGSKELGYSSDLDLIFLMPNDALDFRDQLTRVAQRLQNWLTTLTPAGRAYEIDVRLRPDGVSGLLLSTLDAFATYQKEKAWTWEHQAITRARHAAGNRALGLAFEQVRETIIALPRDWKKLRTDILDMRARIAKEHPNRDHDTLFDLKHDRGGIVDMEFAVQALVLRHGALHPTMRLDHGNIALANRAADLGLLGDNGDRIALEASNAYRELRKLQHAVRLGGAEKARVAIADASRLRTAVSLFYDRAFAA
jgi:[glutamine synthetase] adenylyltransferase / [glutamine synthetase]-adenylyl-L-tyrosine phosphorylase